MNSMNFIGYVIIFIFILYIFTRIKKGPFIFLTAEKHIVFIKDFKFIPNVLEITVGDTVFWINKDQVRHTVISDNDFIPNSEILLYNEDFEHTFAQPGIYIFSSSLYEQVEPMMVIVKQKKENHDESYYETLSRNIINLLWNIYKNIIIKIKNILTLNY